MGAVGVAVDGLGDDHVPAGRSDDAAQASAQHGWERVQRQFAGGAHDAGIDHVRTGQPLATHLRADAVCPDQHIGDDTGPVIERHLHAAVRHVLEADKRLLEANAVFQAFEQGAAQGRPQDVGTTVHHVGPDQRHTLHAVVEDLHAIAGSACALEQGLPSPWRQASLQRLRTRRADVDLETLLPSDIVDLWASFIDGDVDPVLAQPLCQAQAADSAADDRHVQLHA